MSITGTAIAGKTAFRSLGYNATGADLRGLNLEIETDWATFRAGRVKAKVTISELATLDDPYSFTGYGASMDRDNIVAQVEFVQRRSSGQPGSIDANGWHVIGGYRLGSLLPYAIVSRTAPLTHNFPFYLSSTQRTTALGIRWDAFKAADLKFQVDRVDTNGTNGISFTTSPGAPIFPGGPAPGAPVSGKVLVLSVAMDFTF